MQTQPRWRLLIVVNVPWFFVMHRLSIALMARERGADVHVACGEGEGAEDIIAQGFEFHRIPMTRTPIAPWQDLRSLRALRQLYVRIRPDIVHHVTLKPVIYGSLAARLAGVPAVVNAFAGLGYTFVGGSFAARVRQCIIRRMLAAALRLKRQVVVFENMDDLQLLSNLGAVPREHAVVIPGVGVDTSVYQARPEPPPPIRVLFASRMLREKGVEHFVEAAGRLRERGCDARFLLAGTPDPFNPGSVPGEQLSRWHEEGSIEWMGFQQDMPRTIQEAHIVCLPTYYREGVPRILLEGASCARPLVTTDMPGCRDIVRHEVNGLIVKPHDVDGLVAALERLISDGQLRLRLGAASRTLVDEQFTLPRIMDEFWKLYSQLRVAPPT